MVEQASGRAAVGSTSLVMGGRASRVGPADAPQEPLFADIGERATFVGAVQEVLPTLDAAALSASVDRATMELLIRGVEDEHGGIRVEDAVPTFKHLGQDCSADVFVELLKSTWRLQARLAEDLLALRPPPEGAPLSPGHGLPLLVRKRAGHEMVERMLIQHVGARANQFKEVLDDASLSADSNERRVVAVIQASGAGKTHLTTFATGQSGGRLAVAVLFATQDGATKPYELLLQLLHGLRERYKGQELARRALDMLRLFTFAHVEWVLDVLDALCRAGTAVVPQKQCYFQDAALRCQRNGHGQAATTVYLARAVLRTDYGDHEKVKQYKREVRIRTCKYTGELGLNFHVAFDEVQTLLNEMRIFLPLSTYSDDVADVEDQDKHRRSLFAALLLHAKVDLLHTDVNFSVSVCGTNFRIGHYVAVANIAPVREGLNLFTDVDTVDVDSMLASLEHYLVPFEVSDQTRRSLARLQGRAYYFFDRFYAKLWPRLRRIERADSNEMNDVVAAAAAEAFSEAVVHTCTVLKQYWDMDSTAERTTSRSVGSILRDLYLSLRMTNGVVRARTSATVRTLVSTSILVIQGAHKDEDSRLLRLTEEPVAAKAITLLGDKEVLETKTADADPIMRMLTHQLTGLGSDDDVRGRATEDLLNWHLQRRSLRLKGLNSLKRVLSQLMPDGLQWPSALGSCVVHVSGCTRGVPTGSSRRITLEALQDHGTTHVMAGLETNQGADLVLPFADSGGGAGGDDTALAGVVAIQSKARKDPDFNFALRSVDLRYQFCKHSMKGTQPLGAPLHGHAEWEALLKTEPAIASLWVPALFSVRPWGPDIIDIVNEHNESAEVAEDKTHAPVLLLTTSAAALGTAAHNSLRAGLSGKYQPRGSKEKNRPVLLTLLRKVTARPM